ncbi:MAG: CRISPR-associated endonuclease Cas2 [Puniceicoccales bacterium]|jgi:CRISPR-associated protein Cas2|nr:CRISPR-associated endonuclease Cas2 [Puniceicoccales bacterium]
MIESAPDPDWWLQAFTLIPSHSETSGHRCGAHQMLILIAYDISDPKRLHKVARLCEDYGVRVQLSVFECRLEAARFEYFWSELNALLDPATDRAVAYPVCSNCARKIRDVGLVVHNEQVVAYFC